METITPKVTINTKRINTNFMLALQIAKQTYSPHCSIKNNVFGPFVRVSVFLHSNNNTAAS